MKLTRILVISMVLVLALTGCANRQGNTGSSVPGTNVPGTSIPGANVPGASVPNVNDNDLDDFGSDLLDENASIPDLFDYDNSRDIDDISGFDRDVESTLTMSTDFSQIGALSAEKKEWGSGGPSDANLRPDGCTLYQRLYGKYNAYFIAPEEKRIYLTFDEGYENGYTPKILDVLLDHQVKAVFFITYDFAKSQPELVQRMIDEGHTIGNHSTKHLSFPTMPIAEAAADIENLHNYVLENFNYNMTLFRFPMGEFSEQTLALVQSMGYKSVFWSFAYADYNVDAQPDPGTSLNRILDKAHPGGIYLLHAVSKTNAEILDDAIGSLKAKGYILSLFE